MGKNDDLTPAPAPTGPVTPPREEGKTVPTMSPTPFREQGTDQPIDPAVKADYLQGESLIHQLQGTVAKFKIEVMFGRGRTTQGPNAYAIRVFESGRALSGEGDVQIPFCSEVDAGHPSVGKYPPRPKDKKAGCGYPIPDSCIRYATIMARDGSGAFSTRVAHCPHCQGDIPAELAATEIYARTTTDHLAEKLAEIWRQLQGNADIYLKFSAGDIRYQACERKYGGEKARQLRGLHIYDLPRILKDTGAGSSLVERFKAFLKS